MPRGGPLIMEDFVLKALNNGTYGEVLHWVNESLGIFCLKLTHKNNSSWTSEHVKIFVDWDEMKCRQPKGDNYLTDAKQRFKNGLNKSISVKKVDEVTMNTLGIRPDKTSLYFKYSPRPNKANKSKKTSGGKRASKAKPVYSPPTPPTSPESDECELSYSIVAMDFQELNPVVTASLAPDTLYLTPLTDNSYTTWTQQQLGLTPNNISEFNSNAQTNNIIGNVGVQSEQVVPASGSPRHPTDNVFHHSMAEMCETNYPLLKDASLAEANIQIPSAVDDEEEDFHLSADEELKSFEISEFLKFLNSSETEFVNAVNSELSKPSSTK